MIKKQHSQRITLSRSKQTQILARLRRAITSASRVFFQELQLQTFTNSELSYMSMAMDGLQSRIELPGNIAIELTCSLSAMKKRSNLGKES